MACARRRPARCARRECGRSERRARPLPTPARTHTTRDRAPSDSASSRPRGAGGRSTATISSSGSQIGVDMRRVARQAMEIEDRNRARAPLRSLHLHDRVERRHARPPCRSDAWRCTHRSGRESRGCDCGRRSPSSRCRARACCTETRCRRNSSSACAAGDCRRWSPCCATAGSRRRAAPATSTGYAVTISGCCARSLLRTSAPMRTPPFGSGSIARERQPSDVDQLHRLLRRRTSSGRSDWCRRREISRRGWPP